MRKRKFEGKESEVYFNGSMVPEKKVRKEMARQFTLTQEQFHAVSTGNEQTLSTAILSHCSLPFPKARFQVRRKQYLFQRQTPYQIVLLTRTTLLSRAFQH